MTGKGSIGELAKLGYIYKQSNQLAHSQSGNTKVHIECLNYGAITDKDA